MTQSATLPPIITPSLLIATHNYSFGTGKMGKKSLDSPQIPQGYYVVQKVLAKRVRRGALQYKVKWCGYSERNSSWEPVAHLQGVADIISDFEDKSKPRTAKIYTLPTVNPITKRAVIKHGGEVDADLGTTTPQKTQSQRVTRSGKNMLCEAPKKLKKTRVRRIYRPCRLPTQPKTVSTRAEISTTLSQKSAPDPNTAGYPSLQSQSISHQCQVAPEGDHTLKLLKNEEGIIVLQENPSRCSSTVLATNSLQVALGDVAFQCGKLQSVAEQMTFHPIDQNKKSKLFLQQFDIGQYMRTSEDLLSGGLIFTVDQIVLNVSVQDSRTMQVIPNCLVSAGSVKRRGAELLNILLRNMMR